MKHTLYDEITKAGIETGHWQSDLYFPVSVQSRIILRKFPTERANATTFLSEHDGEQWFDVPFAYAPYWKAKP